MGDYEENQSIPHSNRLSCQSKVVLINSTTLPTGKKWQTIPHFDRLTESNLIFHIGTDYDKNQSIPHFNRLSCQSKVVLRNSTTLPTKSWQKKWQTIPHSDRLAESDSTFHIGNDFHVSPRLTDSWLQKVWNWYFLSAYNGVVGCK